MVPGYLRLWRWSVLVLVLLATVPRGQLGAVVQLGVGIGLLTGWALLDRGWRRVAPRVVGTLERLGSEQAAALDALPDARRPAWIALAAGLGLFTELALIREHAGAFPMFAFYKNFSLIACFFGLGAGYALAEAEAVPLLLALPALAAQLVVLTLVRGVFHTGTSITFDVLPILEQRNMGLPWWTSMGAADLLRLVPTYLLLALVFLTTTTALLPIGQWCGRLMRGSGPLRAYGWNLVGSLAGALLFTAISAWWAPPVVWFGLIALGLLLAQRTHGQGVRWGIPSTVVLLCVLAWPAAPGIERTWSPYQVIERWREPDTGWTTILAAGRYHQRMVDLSAPSPATAALRAYYELPYTLFGGAPARVAVVGAGSGNDVAAALRRGSGHVDAIEIDPAILAIGREHPEHPYADPARVRVVLDDARDFLRRADTRYDLVVYGVLDSHAATSHASSVRLDSFVYTREGLADAWSRVDEGGIVYLSFTLLGPEQGQKLYRMLAELQPDHPPIALRVGYDAVLTTAFAMARGRDLDPSVAPAFEDVTAAQITSVPVDVPTDDWPFFYVPRRVVPLSAVPVLALLIGLSAASIRQLLPGVGLERDQLPFSFLGAGFLLVETKAITELGLDFGNTWQVVAVTVAGVLVMGLLANAVAARVGPRSLPWVTLALLGALAAGWWLSEVDLGGVVEVTLLTSPLFFSGLLFSALLRRTSRPVATAMAYNLVGAIVGGTLEWSAMYTGYAALYPLAGLLYVLAAWTARGP
ncbi:MAG: methyltransferase domain-containing protein [Alphaproteobacteria bacterium]|nr:methyltransferase domain-containing protein [Alphaproteobacteria bacterium]MCB9695993.1 methyltransferase domain-containing protein [Alphaproteobacteria bacterium]